MAQGVSIKQEPGIPAQPIVRVGRFGEIKRLMRQLSKRESFIDLELVCSNGSLGCHKFVIGAQSKYLRQLILSASPDGDNCQIHLPDVRKDHMEIILKFLYTGKLGITDSIKHVVRELLEDILHVDAKVSLPENFTLPNETETKKNRKDDGDANGGSGGSTGTLPPPGQPPSKRLKSDETESKEMKNCQSQEKGQQDSSSESGRELKTTSGLVDNMARPLTPPQEIEVCDLDDEVEVLVQHDKRLPLLIDLPDSDDEVTASKKKSPDDRQDNGASIFGDHFIHMAPGIISKRTGPVPFGSSDKIVSAPKIVAKKTVDERGYFQNPNRRNAPSSAVGTQDAFTPSTSTSYEGRNVSEADNSPLLPLPPDLPMLPQEGGDDNWRHRTRTSTGVIRRTNLNESLLEMQTGYGGQEFDIRIEDAENPSSQNAGDFSNSAENNWPLSLPFPLPPPVPLPPAPGMVIKRGKWVPEGSDAKKASSGGEKIHKYHFSPYTVTGRTMDATYVNLAEPEGRHPCDQCPNVYNKRASLVKHKGRMHNSRLTVKCPECPKMLSHRHAVAKHLLSHRPEDQWPFQCEFCGKYFQAKGDLPKHWFTHKHRNDPAIPQPGSPQWFQILSRSKRFDLRKFMNRSLPPINSSGAESSAATAALEANFSDDEDDDLIIEPGNLEDVEDDTLEDPTDTQFSTEAKPLVQLCEANDGIERQAAGSGPPDNVGQSSGATLDFKQESSSSFSPFGIAHLLSEPQNETLDRQVATATPQVLQGSGGPL